MFFKILAGHEQEPGRGRNGLTTMASEKLYTRMGAGYPGGRPGKAKSRKMKAPSARKSRETRVLTVASVEGMKVGFVIEFPEVTTAVLAEIRGDGREIVVEFADGAKQRLKLGAPTKASVGASVSSSCTMRGTITKIDAEASVLHVANVYVYES